MGLFDSRDGASEDGSTAQVRAHTRTPVRALVAGLSSGHAAPCPRLCVCVVIVPADSQVAGCASCAGGGLLGHGTQRSRNCQGHGGV